MAKVKSHQVSKALNVSFPFPTLFPLSSIPHLLSPSFPYPPFFAFCQEKWVSPGRLVGLTLFFPSILTLPLKETTVLIGELLELL